MKITRQTINSAANIASRLWSMISTVAFLPLYLAYLGEESYGLVTLFATLQATMSLLGLGLSSTLRREFSLGNESDENKEYKRKLLISVEIIYYIACIISIVVLYYLSGTIASRWLAENSLSPDLVSKAITLMGVTIGLQMLSNLWHGCLLGLNHQVKANIYQILFSLIKNCLAVVVAYYYQSIILYYYVFIIVDVLYCITLRISTGRYLINSLRKSWRLSDMKMIRRVWKYAAGIVSISILSLFMTQLDKIILSRYLSLREIGAYNSMFTLGSLSRVLSTGVSVAVLTEFSQLYSVRDYNKLEKNYIFTWKAVACFTACVVTYIAFFAETIMIVWSQNDFYAVNARNYAPYLMIGIGAVALQEIPYSYLLAKGRTNVNIILGVVILPIYGVSSYFAIKNYGMLGASIVYALVFSAHTIVYLAMANKDIKNKREVNKVYLSILVTILISSCFAALTKYASQIIENEYLRLLLAVISGLICCCLLLIFILGKGVLSEFFIMIKSRGRHKSKTVK